MEKYTFQLRKMHLSIFTNIFNSDPCIWLDQARNWTRTNGKDEGNGGENGRIVVEERERGAVVHFRALIDDLRRIKMPQNAAAQ